MKRIYHFVFWLVMSLLQVGLSIGGWLWYLDIVRQHTSGIWGTIFAWDLWNMGGAIFGILFVFLPFIFRRMEEQLQTDKEGM